jgi:NADH-quinone oxidoreductase subunit J
MLLWALLGLLLIFIVLCAIFRDLLYVAISLALASAVLATVLFHFGANIAAVFELSVCAGLITVLFVSTVSLTKDSDQAQESRLRVYLVPFVLLLIIGINLLLVKWLGTAITPAVVAPAAPAQFQDIFWGQRTIDVLGQVSLVLAGVFGILAIFRISSSEHKHE